jgi:hypothetical protein
MLSDPRSSSFSLETIRLTAQPLTDNKICPRPRVAALLHDLRQGNPQRAFVTSPLPCMRRGCPVCDKIKRGRLLRRLRKARWPRKVYMWTLTTDPSVIDPSEALTTINKRFHQLMREVHREYGHIEYFKAIEFTKSGLPHIHMLTTSRLAWRRVASLARAKRFGRILWVSRMPRKIALAYASKYATKGIRPDDPTLPQRLRLWSQSRRFLPTWTDVRPAPRYALVRMLSLYHAAKGATIQITEGVLSVSPGYT